MRPLALLAFVATMSVATAACAPSRTQTTGDSPAIAELHRRKCGSCHRLVEPFTRPRAELERALARHGKRVRLTPEEWRALVDYLAPAPATSGESTSAPAPPHVSVSGSWSTPARPD